MEQRTILPETTTFIDLCKGGKLRDAQLLYRSGRVDIHAQLDKAFRMSCCAGHSEIAEWLISLGGVKVYAWCYPLFSGACEDGN